MILSRITVNEKLHGAKFLLESYREWQEVSWGMVLNGRFGC
jgi:hypothetical protein